jgi:hypothetical protein
LSDTVAPAARPQFTFMHELVSERMDAMQRALRLGALLAAGLLAGTALAAPSGSSGAHPPGQGTHMGREPTAAGVYFGDRHRAAVRAWYEQHPLKEAHPVDWRIGHALPRDAAPRPVPAALLRELPKQPPGHHYVQAGGDILLVANGSRMVVDGISAVAR